MTALHLSVNPFFTFYLPVSFEDPLRSQKKGERGEEKERKKAHRKRGGRGKGRRGTPPPTLLIFFNLSFEARIQERGGKRRKKYWWRKKKEGGGGEKGTIVILHPSPFFLSFRYYYVCPATNYEKRGEGGEGACREKEKKDNEETRKDYGGTGGGEMTRDALRYQSARSLGAVKDLVGILFIIITFFVTMRSSVRTQRRHHYGAHARHQNQRTGMPSCLPCYQACSR